jgi:predicted phage-related endonuclease
MKKCSSRVLTGDVKAFTLHDMTQKLIAERKRGIGGSDCASVFNLGYGCRKRLWYDKRNETQDFPFEENDAMRLGKVLEPFFVAKYCEATNRNVKYSQDAPAYYHHEHSELLVHVDGIVIDDEKGMGVLEIKSVGRAMFYKIKREGLPHDYIMQLQHGMLVTDLKWGSYAIGCRDNGDMIHWDVERSEAICNEILYEGLKFWAQVQNGPMPDALEPDDRRCQNCQYRTKCQGEALQPALASSDYEADDSLSSLVQEYSERRELLKQAEELLDEVKQELMAKMGDRTMVESGGAKIQYYTIHKKAYTVAERDERPLRIYLPKEKK